MIERLSEQDLADLLTSVGAKGADLVFGETRVVGDHAAIPVARIVYAGGGLFGGGRGRARADGEGRGAEGLGAGVGVAAQPVGLFEVGPRGVRWVPMRSSGPMALLAALVGVGLLALGARRR